MKALMKSETLHLVRTSSRLQTQKKTLDGCLGRSAAWLGEERLPFQRLGQSLLQVGGGCREGELDGDAAAVVEDGGEVVSFGGGQDGQLVVGLTCRGTTGWSAQHETTNMAAHQLDYLQLMIDRLRTMYHNINTKETKTQKAAEDSQSSKSQSFQKMEIKNKVQ